MSNWLRIVLALVVGAHGIGHILFVMPGLVLFWTRPSTSPAISALIFDVLVLTALLIFHWPTAVQTSG